MTMFPSITMVPNEDEYTRKKRIAQGMLSRPITRQCSVSQTQKLNLGNNNSSSSSTSENQDLPGGGEMGSRLGSEMDEQGTYVYLILPSLPQSIRATLIIFPKFALFAPC